MIVDEPAPPAPLQGVPREGQEGIVELNARCRVGVCHKAPTAVM